MVAGGGAGGRAQTLTLYPPCTRSETLLVSSVFKTCGCGSVSRGLDWEPQGRRFKSPNRPKYGMWTATWRGPSSPPRPYRDALEQGTLLLVIGWVESRVRSACVTNKEGFILY